MIYLQLKLKKNPQTCFQSPNVLGPSCLKGSNHYVQALKPIVMFEALHHTCFGLLNALNPDFSSPHVLDLQALRFYIFRSVKSQDKCFLNFFGVKFSIGEKTSCAKCTKSFFGKKMHKSCHILRGQKNQTLPHLNNDFLGVVKTK